MGDAAFDRLDVFDAPEAPSALGVLDGLDATQRAAVESDAAPLAILAGAGSGKTRVLTRRIAHRVQIGAADARHVLALTFTRKAAGELTHRLRRLGVERLIAGTFHAIALAQLRGRASDAGQRAPAVLGRKVGLLLPLVRESGAAAVVAAGELASEIEWAKARRVRPEDYVDAATRAGREPARPLPTIAEGYRAYEDEKRKRGLVDFDDLIWQAAHALKSDETFAAAQRWRFRHLFVDEFQDTTPAQIALLRGWLGDRTDLTVVGDPDQAIFGFAGANPTYLTRFDEHFRGGASLRLDSNYRSSPQVVAAARAALPDRSRGLVVRTPRPDGPQVTIEEHASDLDEAKTIATALRKSRGNGRPWSASAVLYRTHAQSAVLEESLRAEGVPFRVRGGPGFLAHAEVKALLETLRVAARTAPGRSLVAQLDDLADDSEGERQEFASVLAGLGREYAELEGEAGTLAGFIDYLRVSLRHDAPEGRGADAVSLLTFHAAKGLEFETVFVAGIERGLVPISRAKTSAQVAEERRLLYVALSRAATELHVSWAATRGTRTGTRTPSPWLAPIVATTDAVEPVDPTPRREQLDLVRRRLRDPEGPSAEDKALFDALATWRRRLAKASQVPAFVIFSDATLRAVAAARPTSAGALLAVPGIGPVKLERYGPTLLEIVNGSG